jgi:ectoine hydroxylase-related dioxygenase (phytanoyl-CoA dioxygenase family)
MADRRDLFAEQGYILSRNILHPELVGALRAELEIAITREAAAYGTFAARDYGMLLAAPIYGGTLLRLAEHRELFALPNEILGDGCIIHVYTSSSMPPGAGNYSSRIHRERSSRYPDIADFIGVIILLDDFTEQNGATWYLPASHRQPEQPSEQEFYARAKRLIAPAGSVFYFDWRLWHAGSINQTPRWRHALAMGITPAYHKQKIDLPRAIPSEYAASLDDFGRQKLGFFSVPPSSLDEYYAPAEKRTYRQSPV